jgi:teichuronic acid biosynthesis glycosyltransferase TuaG
MDNPLVSIVVPMFNAETLIEATVKSVINQSYENWELIIVDDCSSDDSLSVVREKFSGDPRIKCHPLDENMGAPAGPRNIGVGLAQGDYIAFLDADDIWHPMKLELQLTALKNSKFKFCSTQMFDFYEDQSIEFSDLKLNPSDISAVSYHQLLRKNRIPTSTVLALKSYLVSNQFNEDLSYRAVEDYDCWLRLHQEFGDSIKLKLPLLAYRKFDGISSSKSSMIKKVFMVLSNHKRKNGKALGLSKYLYMMTYGIMAIYLRVFKKEL